jgi:predicted AlkP superfamily phosphohydrolase/phosphomutase
MNGVLISGFVSIDINKSVYPTSLIPKLEQLDYRLDVDSQKAHENMDLFMEDLDRTLAARIEAYRFLWDYMDWQVFMLTFTATDRLMHFLWSAYEDENHRYHRDFLEHFRKIDEIVGEINGKISESDTLILLSDHGFERLEKDIYINRLLTDEGFLTLRGTNEPSLANIDHTTKAFALDPSRIYINEDGKYPRGTITDKEKPTLINDLCSLFLSIEVDGRSVIREVHRKEDIYCGPYVDNAPDLVLIANDGFNLKGSLASSELVSRGIFTGKHTYQDAFLLTNNTEIRRFLPEQPSVIDEGKIIRNLVKDIEEL